jgi:hypothetical protein
VILATSYERPTWLLSQAFAIGSSNTIATWSGIAPLWRNNAIIWETSSPARASADGRVIAGGEDEDFGDARQRDALIREKGERIAAKLAAMVATEGI